MKHVLLFGLMLASFFSYSQYPVSGVKQRLGWQTTGDGLVYRGAISDTSTLDPSGINNAWMLLDTASGNLYAYRIKAWRLVSGGGGGISMPFDSVTFTTTAENTALEGELTYNNQSGTLVLGMAGGIEIPIGQGEAHIVRNSTGTTIQKGKVVYISGTTGQRPKISLSDADTEVRSSVTFGITAEAIPANDSGFVFTSGYIKGINTNSFTAGEALWLDTIPGGFTHTKPTAPVNSVLVGYVITQKNNGTIFVKIQNGYEIDELHNVVTAGKVNNSVIRYDSATALWKASTTAGIVAGDTSAMLANYINVVDTAAMLTNYVNIADTAAMLTNYINIADTATMLSSYISNADTSVFARDFQISGTSGQVTYFNGSNTVTGDANLTWSAANRTLGINTTTTSGANIIIKNTQEPIRDAAWLPNQTFGADTTNWTKGTGWTFNGTQAVATAATGALTYTTLPDTIISGRAYEVTYTLASYSAGTVTVAIGNVSVILPAYNVTANVVLLTPTSATGGFRFTTSTFTGNLDNVAVVEVRNPALVLLAGQDDGASTLYNSLRMPNGTTIAFGGGSANTTGSNNNFFGFEAGNQNSVGTDNNFLGNQAGQNNTIGSSNNFFGNQAGRFNTRGSNNNFFGTSAGLSNSIGNSNNFFGFRTGESNAGSNNNFFGSQSGFRNTTASGNNFFGNQAGFNNTIGSDNNFFGNQAGQNNIAGTGNNFFGSLAGVSSVGNRNNFFGQSAGQVNSGDNNNFLGLNTGSINTIGSNNNFFGNQAGRSNTRGSNNNFIGSNTGYNTTAADTLTGSNNNVIGSESARNIASSAGSNLVLGSFLNLPTGNGSNQVVIKNLIFGTGASGTGTTIQTTAKAGINVNNPQSTLDVEGNMAIGATYSGTTAAPTNGLIVEGNTGIGTSSPQRRLHITGTVRVDTLTRDVPTRLVGADADGDLAAVTLGTGLSIASGTLNTSAILPADTSVFARDWQIAGTTNYLPKFTGASSIGNSVIQESGGNIAINATPSAFKLDINGSTHTTGDFYADRASRSSSAGFVSAQTNNRWLSGMISNSGSWHVYDLLKSTSVMTLDSATGRVGIGTTSPARTLHVAGEARISDLTTDTPTRIVGADTDGDLGAITLGIGLNISSGTLNASGITSVYIPINLFSPGDTVTNTTNAKNFFLVHSGLNGYCIDSYTVKAIAGTGTADIQVDKNDTGGNLQAISGTTVYTKDTNIALVTGDYIRGQVFNISGTLIGLGLTLEIKATCN